MLELSSSFAGLVEDYIMRVSSDAMQADAASAASTGLPPLPLRRPETYATPPSQPPPIPPRVQVNAAPQIAKVAAPPVLPPRPSTTQTTSRETRFVPPVPTGGMMQAPRAPPKRTVEPVEVPGTSGRLKPCSSIVLTLDTLGLHSRRARQFASGTSKAARQSALQAVQSPNRSHSKRSSTGCRYDGRSRW
jgi:hypothetical protein